MDHPPPWTVAQFATMTAVPASTLRFWDDEGLLPAHRLDNGHRRYVPEHVPRLEMVRMCQALGCTLDEVRLVLDAADPAERAAFAHRRLPELLAKIDMLQLASQVLRHVAVCDHPDAATCGTWMQTVMASPGTDQSGGAQVALRSADG